MSVNKKVKERLNQVDFLLSRINKERDKLIQEKESLESKLSFVTDDEESNKFLETYQGLELLRSHSLSEYGQWEIRGEDPNCDFGGPHTNPTLGFLEGYLKDVIKVAVRMDGFYQWGGGYIVKRKEPVIVKV